MLVREQIRGLEANVWMNASRHLVAVIPRKNVSVMETVDTAASRKVWVYCSHSKAQTDCARQPFGNFSISSYFLVNEQLRATFSKICICLATLSLFI